jgi:hypothetical protein
MIAEEMTCTVTEAKSRTTPQEFLDKIEFWKTHPPLRDHINVCMANIAFTVANCNRSPKSKAIEFSKFLIDYKKALLPSKKKVVGKIKSILGALSKKG